MITATQPKTKGNRNSKAQKIEAFLRAQGPLTARQLQCALGMEEILPVRRTLQDLERNARVIGSQTVPQVWALR